MPDRCSETVYPKTRFGAFHGHRCYRMAILEREGKPYCKQHDPEAVKERERKSTEQWKAKHESRTVPFRELTRLREIERLAGELAGRVADCAKDGGCEACGTLARTLKAKIEEGK